MEEKDIYQKMVDVKNVCESEDEHSRVKNVRFIGKVTINGKEKEVFLCEMYTKGKTGDLIEIEKVYTEDLELIAANVKEDGYEMALTKKYAEEDNLLEQLKENIEKDKKIDKELNEEIEPQIDFTDDENTTEQKIPEDSNDKKVKTYMQIDPDVKVTERETMASMLKIEGKGYTKLEIVESDGLDTGENTSKFAVVGVRRERE